MTGGRSETIIRRGLTRLVDEERSWLADDARLEAVYVHVFLDGRTGATFGYRVDGEFVWAAQIVRVLGIPQPTEGEFDRLFRRAEAETSALASALGDGRPVTLRGVWTRQPETLRWVARQTLPEFWRGPNDADTWFDGLSQGADSLADPDAL